MYRCIVTVATSPACVFTGYGSTNEAAEDAAAQSALDALLPLFHAQVSVYALVVYAKTVHNQNGPCKAGKKPIC